MDLGLVATAWANAGGRIWSRRLPASLSNSTLWVLLLASLSEKKRATKPAKMLARLGYTAFGLDIYAKSVRADNLQLPSAARRKI